MEKAVKINPNHAAANYDYGLALTNIKDFEKAKEHALKALELTPSGPDRERYLQGGLWLIHIGLKDFDEAIKSMEYMLEKNPGFTGAYGFMASLHALKGNIDIAKGHLAKYQELRPKVKTLKDYEKVAPTIVKVSVALLAVVDPTLPVTVLNWSGALALAPPAPIHLFSTVRPFSWYISNCDEFAPHRAARRGAPAASRRKRLCGVTRVRTDVG